VPKPRGGGQIGSTTEMKQEHDDRLKAGGDLGKPGEFLLGTLQPPEIVGEVAKPVLEAIRRLWWRGLDRRAHDMRLSIGSRRALRNPLWCPLAGVGLIAPYPGLVAVQQLGQHRVVGGIGRRGDRCMEGFPNAGYEPHPSCGDCSLTARSPATAS
jgi:hypothetical protein